MCEELLQQALGKSELGDVRFHVDGAWVASGHRSVLSARSGVLGRMFANDTEERRSGVIRMDDVTAEGLVAFLEFVYLGTAAASVLIGLDCILVSQVTAERQKVNPCQGRPILYTAVCVCVCCVCACVCVCVCVCIDISM